MGNEQMNYVPIVIEKEERGERSYDIYSRLLKDRIIFLSGQVNDQVASTIIAQMLFLQSSDSKKDISFYINSPGGGITAGLAIIDTMDILSCDVATYCVGQCASMGAVLLSNGAKGKRFATKHSRVMIHQPLSGTEGQCTDIMLHAREVERLGDELYDIMAQNTGMTSKKMKSLCDRDNFMSAIEAKNLGFIDEILMLKKS